MTEQNAKEMEEWARRVKHLIFPYVRSFHIPLADVSDIVQEVFIDVLLRDRPLPTDPKEQKAVLLKIAKFRVRAYFTERSRNRSRVAVAREYATITCATFARDVAELLEARQQLEFILPEMSEEQLEVLTTKVLERRKIRDVAAQLGMNENTARGTLSRALEMLREKLEHLDRRGVRGVIILLAISSVLALSRAASAMVEHIRKLFPSAEHSSLRSVVGVGTAAAIMLTPPNIGASAKYSEKQVSSSIAMFSAFEHDMPHPSAVDDERVVEMAPAVSTSRISASKPIPRRAAPKMLPLNELPPDRLLGMAMSSMQNGHPEKALKLLEQYPAQDLKWVEALRARAKAALAAKKIATH